MYRFVAVRPRQAGDWDAEAERRGAGEPGLLAVLVAEALGYDRVALIGKCRRCRFAVPLAHRRVDLIGATNVK
jgi:hypothetical protein